MLFQISILKETFLLLLKWRFAGKFTMIIEDQHGKLYREIKCYSGLAYLKFSLYELNKYDFHLPDKEMGRLSI